MTPSNRIVVGITGASGAVYAVRVIELLARANVDIHLAVSRYGRRLLLDELGMGRLDPEELTGGRGSQLTIHAESDAGAALGSGSFEHDGMVIVPCSSNTLARLAAGITDNLLHRAAAVTLKERRRLVIAHRETPLSLIELENMRRLTEAGAIIAPLAPGFYMAPRAITDLVDFMAGKVLDLLGVPHDLNIRWDEHLKTPGEP